MIDIPPLPPGAKPKIVLQSPKAQEQQSSLGSPMVRVSVAPLVLPAGFSLTNITVAGNTVTLSWQQGYPPFQVQSKGAKGWVNVGPQTTNRSITFPVQGPMGFFRVQSISSTPPTDSGITIGMGGMNFPTKMAHRASDNLHGLLRGLYGYQNDLFLWHDTLDDVRSISLPGNPTSAGCVTDFFGNNRLAYAERSGTNNRVIEWGFDSGMTTATVVTNFNFDHPYSTVASCTLSNRPVIMSADNEVTNKAQMAFMVVWKDSLDRWQTKRIVMDSSTAGDTLPTVCLSLVEYHGEIYSFFTRDSSAAIGLVILGGDLSVTYSNANWLSFPAITDSKLLVSDEAPTVWASVDTVNDRIILAYQCMDGETNLCAGMVNNNNYAHMSLVEFAGALPYLISETEWYDSHTSFGLIPVWSDANGITFNSLYWSPTCDWSKNGIQGARYAGSLNTTWFIPGANAEVLSYSDDGWCVIFTDDWMNHLCLAK